MAEQMNRRTFLRDTTATTVGLAVAAEATAAVAPRPPLSFASPWGTEPDRVWLGADYWANPLQDWRLEGGRIECVRSAPERNVQLLTAALGESPGSLAMSVRVGRLKGERLAAGRGSFGFRIGIQGPLREYRNSLIFGTGLDAGATADGHLFIGNLNPAQTGAVDLNRDSIELRLTAEPEGDRIVVTLSAHDAESGKPLAEVRRGDLAAERLTGNLALVANFGTAPAAPGQPQAKAKAQAKTKAQTGPGRGTGTFWFSDWRVSGEKVELHPDRAFGPILFSQYTLSLGVLKLTAQMVPLGPEDSPSAFLEVERDGTWTRIASTVIHPECRTATFRLEGWDVAKDTPYRVAYTLKHSGGEPTAHHWHGTIRRDPVHQPVITVADVSCNTHAAFPNAAFVEAMTKLNPDMLAFVGDQFYESSGGYGTVRSPLDVAILDYLRKWYLHGWTWRTLTRDRPSVALPDDHDVYQGNIWGEAGQAQRTTQEAGGYEMPGAWVNVVYRTQTEHHPDPYDPTPIAQGIRVFYGPLTYGRISFAVLADRQFKSGPEGKVPATGSRGDHVLDASFDPTTADRPGLELLGERQMRFLRDWAADWRGAEMKAVISQTVFVAMATTHGGNREVLRADYDANGWPQTPRNAALREIRKAFALHIAGDQHLPAVVHYGVDGPCDAGVAFAGPAVNVGYPRWWEPSEPGKNRAQGAPETTGDFVDHFGNPMTVLAVANGAIRPRSTLLEQLHDRASGLALVRFDKGKRTITLECWPFLADVTEPNTQFPGWPVTVNQLDNYARKPVAHLPRLEIRGVDQPVVQVLEEPTGAVVYTLRIAGRTFQPHVFAAGPYTVKVSEPESGKLKELRGLVARAGNDSTLEVSV
jgi:phosphodiesterase/alkaline phosphatase D-like protein